jgi:hypothetical protein
MLDVSPLKTMGWMLFFFVEWRCEHADSSLTIVRWWRSVL